MKQKIATWTSACEDCRHCKVVWHSNVGREESGLPLPRNPVILWKCTRGNSKCNMLIVPEDKTARKRKAKGGKS